MLCIFMKKLPWNTLHLEETSFVMEWMDLCKIFYICVVDLVSTDTHIVNSAHCQGSDVFTYLPYELFYIFDSWFSIM